MPRFSIVTAVYNGANTILEALGSVASQSVDVEHIIIDGGSQDRTVEVLRSYPAQERLHIVSEADGGIYDAMNKGLRMARGQIVGFLNADDFYAGDAVLSQVDEVFSDRAVNSCYGDLAYVARNDLARVTRYWRAGPFRREAFYHGWMPPHPTFFVRREIYERYGAFNLSLGSAADYELMLRFLVRHRITTCYIPGLMVKMRVGGTSNASLLNRLKANRMDRQAWRINQLQPLPWTLWAKPARKISQFFPRLTAIPTTFLTKQ